MEVIQHFSPTSKVWVYQATRNITHQEQEAIVNLLTTFTSSWNSHGAAVQGTFQIKYNRFIVLIADDQSGVSGCSIDSSVKVIREIEDRFGLGLLDRTSISYKTNNLVATTSLQQLKQDIGNQLITPETLIFNNSVATLQEFEQNWEQQAQNSWMARYF